MTEIKSPFMNRNNSLSKNTESKINSLQKQLASSQSQQQQPTQCEMQQESSAIMQLLEIKDQHVEWKDKRNKNKIKINKYEPKKTGQFNQSFSKFLDFNGSKKQNSQEQITDTWTKSQFNNIFHKKPNNDDYKKKSKSFKHSEQTTRQQTHKLLKNHHNSTFFLNRTHYWKKPKSNIESRIQQNDLSFTQKFQKRFFPNDTFYQKQKNMDQMRVNSHLEFYRKKSPFGDENVEQNRKQMQFSRLLQNKSIKIVPNKAITVRQMLDKIRSHEDINIAESTIQNNKVSDLFTHRQPFYQNPKKKPRQHYKKFTPFKIQQQKRLQYSLQKLQEHIKKNPQIENKLDELQIKYLSKPTYCSWVQRNKQKIKKKKTYPLTVKPLKMLN